jgi:hypothetical protein
MALSPEARMWLDENGLGPVVHAIETNLNPSEWTEKLQNAHPELTIREADELIGYGLQARELGRLSISAGVASVHSLPLESSAVPGATRNVRYRFRFTFIDPITGEISYRMGIEDVPDLLSPAEVDALADRLANEMIDPNKDYLPGFEYAVYRVDAVTVVHT